MLKRFSGQKELEVDKGTGGREGPNKEGEEEEDEDNDDFVRDPDDEEPFEIEIVEDEMEEQQDEEEDEQPSGNMPKSRWDTPGRSADGQQQAKPIKQAAHSTKFIRFVDEMLEGLIGTLWPESSMTLPRFLAECQFFFALKVRLITNLYE